MNNALRVFEQYVWGLNQTPSVNFITNIIERDLVYEYYD